MCNSVFDLRMVCLQGLESMSHLRVRHPGSSLGDLSQKHSNTLSQDTLVFFGVMPHYVQLLCDTFIMLHGSVAFLYQTGLESMSRLRLRHPGSSLGDLSLTSV